VRKRGKGGRISYVCFRIDQYRKNKIRIEKKII